MITLHKFTKANIPDCRGGGGGAAMDFNSLLLPQWGSYQGTAGGKSKSPPVPGAGGHSYK